MSAIARVGTVVVLALLVTAAPAVAAARGTRVKVAVPGVERIDLVRDDAEGTFVYRVRYDDGRSESMTPDAFAAALHRIRVDRPRWQRVLNVSSPAGIAWVALGLLGQVLFACRMLVQWLVSEKERRSVVPVAFWWISLAGATMLLVYFLWRKDIVGVLGQATGWLVYVRNLILIHRGGPPASPA